MIILLCENYRSPIDSLLDKLKPQFPPSAIVYVDRENWEDSMKVLDNRPLLGEKWLVLINIKEPQDPVITQASRDHVVSVFIFRNSEDMIALGNKLSLKEIKYSQVDNSKVSKEALISYVENKLQIDSALAKYICNRHQFYVPKVIETVEFMELTGIKEKDQIRKYTQRTGDISYIGVFDYVIGVGDVKFNRVLTLVHRYRSGHKHLLDFLIDRLDIYLYVYEQAIRGRLSFENVKDFYEANKDRFEKVPEYVLNKALDSMSEVSYDYLYFLSLLYNKERSNTSLSSFIYLLKMSQEGR